MLPQCIKRVQGASKIDAETLKKFQLSEHIQRLLEKRDGNERQL